MKGGEANPSDSLYSPGARLLQEKRERHETIRGRPSIKSRASAAISTGSLKICGMEQFPVEIVGDILSRIADARPVVLASMASRKWLRAFREHLRALSFMESDWGGFRGLSDTQIEALLSRTILQTTSLQSLIIDAGRLEVELSIPAAMSWLLHTRKSLRELVLDVRGMPVVEICGCEKLEKLTLAHGVIEGVDPNHHRFSSLRSLSLQACVRISDTDLRALLSACPKLESLELMALGLYGLVEDLNVAAPPSLRSFCIGRTYLDTLIFESGTVEHLHLTGARLEWFKFIGKGTLTNLTIDTTFVLDLDIFDSGARLESIDITYATTAVCDLCRLISISSNLQKLGLWDVSYTDWCKAIGLETVALNCPQLNLLSLSCSLQYRQGFPYSLGGSTRFENIAYLKIGWSDTLTEEYSDEFFNLVEALLDRCPGLTQLVISDLGSLKDGPRLSTPISRIRSKCADSSVQLDFIK